MPSGLRHFIWQRNQTKSKIFRVRFRHGNLWKLFAKLFYFVIAYYYVIFGLNVWLRLTRNGFFWKRSSNDHEWFFFFRGLGLTLNGQRETIIETKWPHRLQQKWPFSEAFVSIKLLVGVQFDGIIVSPVSKCVCIQKIPNRRVMNSKDKRPSLVMLPNCQIMGA